MSNCGTNRFLGADAVVSIAWNKGVGIDVCPTDDPATLTFDPVMSLTSKSNNNTLNTTGTRTDSDKGAYTPTIVIGAEGAIELSGVIDTTDDNFIDLDIEVYNKMQSVGGDKGVYAFVKVVDPSITEITYALITDISKTYDTEAESTHNITLTKQNSGFNSKSKTPAP
jgi:hypothetical protein